MYFLEMFFFGKYTKPCIFFCNYFLQTTHPIFFHVYNQSTFTRLLLKSGLLYILYIGAENLKTLKTSVKVTNYAKSEKAKNISG